MSVEAITEAIHEYMYEKLNESPETEEKKSIHGKKQIWKKNKPNATRRPDDWTATDAEHLAGPNNTTVPQKKRSVLNAVNWDTMQNVAGQQEK